MHSTGIIKDIDELGRFVIPGNIRKKLDVKTFEIFLDDEGIFLKKIDVDICAFCNNRNDLVKFDTKRICNKCIEKIKNL